MASTALSVSVSLYWPPRCCVCLIAMATVTLCLNVPHSIGCPFVDCRAILEPCMLGFWPSRGCLEYRQPQICGVCHDLLISPQASRAHALATTARARACSRINALSLTNTRDYHRTHVGMQSTAPRWRTHGRWAGQSQGRCVCVSVCAATQGRHVAYATLPAVRLMTHCVCHRSHFTQVRTSANYIVVPPSWEGSPNGITDTAKWAMHFI